LRISVMSGVPIDVGHPFPSEVGRLFRLMSAALADTQFARASCATIRLKLLKIGAMVRTSVRRIKLSMPSAFPYRAEYTAAHGALVAATTA
jgi:hypothetical protein